MSPNLKTNDNFTRLIALFTFLLILLSRLRYFDSWQSGFSMSFSIAFAYFGLEFLIRAFSAKKKFLFLKTFPVDAIVLLPSVLIFLSVTNETAVVLSHLTVVIYIMVTRTQRIQQRSSALQIGPAQWIILSFFFTICTGGILLTLSDAVTNAPSTPFIDALFTSTSATCVTGLAVRDTGTWFSPFGQALILILIQIGGLGIMTFSVFFHILSGKNIRLGQRILLKDILDRDTLSGAAKMILFIVASTLGLEMLGALLLGIVWHGHTDSLTTTIWYSVFHSISAFCNAGFALYSNNLMDFRDDIPTNIIISSLIIFGGLGFMVLHDILMKVLQGTRIIPRRHYRMSIQTRVVLLLSVALIFIGTLLYFIMELPAAVAANQSPFSLILPAYFQSVSARTAGYNSINIGLLQQATLVMIIGLMFIGASPGSTGGGIKTTTFAILWASVTKGFRPDNEVEIFKRTIPAELVYKAGTVFFLYASTLFISVVALLMVEQKPVLDLTFEAVSAMGTVGLSTGITSKLTPIGKLIIIILMFIGRVGPLTLGYAFHISRGQSNYRYAEERIMIG